MRCPLLGLVTLSACVPPPGGEYFEPAAFFVEGTFAYDAVADEAVGYATSEGEVEPFVALIAVREAWFETFDDAHRCSIVLQHPGPHPRTTQVPDEVWFAFALPDDATVTTDCTGWDPAVWGDDPASVLAGSTWGLGLGPLDPDVEEQLQSAVIAQSDEATWQDAWVPLVFGGGVLWSGAEERTPHGWLPNDYAFAAEVDDDFVREVDAQGEAIPVPVSEVVDGTPPTAAYVLRSWYGLQADLLHPTNL